MVIYMILCNMDTMPPRIDNNYSFTVSGIEDKNCDKYSLRGTVTRVLIEESDVTRTYHELTDYVQRAAALSGRIRDKSTGMALSNFVHGLYGNISKTSKNARIMNFANEIVRKALDDKNKRIKTLMLCSLKKKWSSSIMTLWNDATHGAHEEKFSIMVRTLIDTNKMVIDHVMGITIKVYFDIQRKDIEGIGYAFDDTAVLSS